MQKKIIIGVSIVAVLALAYFGYKWYTKKGAPASVTPDKRGDTAILKTKPASQTIAAVNVNGSILSQNPTANQL